VFALAACGGDGPPSGLAPTGTAALAEDPDEVRECEAEPPPPSEPTDWNADPFEGLAHQNPASREEARTLLPFEPIAPASLGAPALISVANAGTDPPDVELALVYRDPTLGTIWIREDSSGLDQQAIDDATSADLCWCCVVHTSVVLDGGQRATVLRQPVVGATSVWWIQNGVFMSIAGPPDELSPETAVALASEMSRAGGQPAA
jgi:hypothetical protein